MLVYESVATLVALKVGGNHAVLRLLTSSHPSIGGKLASSSPSKLACGVTALFALRRSHPGRDGIPKPSVSTLGELNRDPFHSAEGLCAARRAGEAHQRESAPP